MGRYIFRLPDIGEGVAEAEIVTWHVKPGDMIEEDGSLADVMTDKATVDMTSPVSGKVIAVHGEIGHMLAVGAPLAEIEVEGDGNESEMATDSPSPQNASTAPPSLAPDASEPDAPTSTTEPATPAPSTERPSVLATRAPGEAPLAAPATRRRAHKLGIPLQYVTGTGPGGRITSKDLDAFIARGGVSAPVSKYGRRTAVHQEKIIGLRRKIAEKMQNSKRRIPHFGYVEEFDLTELETLRQNLNAEKDEGQPKLTLLSFFMRAVALLQREFPHINSCYDDEAGILFRYEAVHIGIATQTPGGLMVPIVRHVEAMDIWDCASELGRVTAAARNGTANREELSGSTITLTSLGTLGGISATPVINAPEVAIIGPNKLVERVVVRNGQMVIRNMMNISTSFDHRIVDGYDAARFVQRLKRLIEHPGLLFVEPS